MQITAATWIESTTIGRSWDQQRDSGRIRAAFSTLALTRESWPAPKHFLDALPRVEQAAIGYEVKPATPEQAAAALKKIRDMLGEPMPVHTPPVKREGPPLADVEADLKLHYCDRKSAAAGES